MKLLVSTVALATILISLPILSLAAAPDHNADAVQTATNQVYQPQNLLGAPDSAYADFWARDHYVVLDMGAEELGTGDLTLYYQLFDFGAQFRVRLYDKDFVEVFTYGQTLPIQQTEVKVAYDGATPYRYVRIESIATQILRLDAIMAEGVTTGVATPPTPPEEEEGPAPTPQGLLVKLPDDQDPATSVDEAVYFVGTGNQRHAFPSEKVFKSWYPDFSDLSYIDADNLALYALGKNMTVRPGTYLIKVTTSPKTYAVAPGGVLRWIKTEEVAIALYGNDWAKRVIDVADVFFNNYTIGEPLEMAMYPDGTVGILPSGEVTYLAGTKYYSLPGAAVQEMRLQNKYYVTVGSAVAAQYTSGGEITPAMIAAAKYAY